MNPNAAQDIGDVAAMATASGAYFQFLPEVAALFAIIWTGIRIYEWMEARFCGKPPTDIRKD